MRQQFGLMDYPRPDIRKWTTACKLLTMKALVLSDKHQPILFYNLQVLVDILNMGKRALTLTFWLWWSKQRAENYDSTFGHFLHLDVQYIATNRQSVVAGAIRSTNLCRCRLTQSSQMFNTNLTALLNYDKTIGDDHNRLITSGRNPWRFFRRFSGRPLEKLTCPLPLIKLGVGVKLAGYQWFFGYNRPA